MRTKTDNPGQSDKISSTPLVKRIAKILGALLSALLAIALFLGLFPVSLKESESTANPSEDYDDALHRFEKIQQNEQSIVNDAGGSQIMSHGHKTDRVYVLVHGITNSPLQFVELGEMLFDSGANVLIMRMPYHGLKSHQASELKQLKAKDLRGYSDETLDIAVGLGDAVDVIGISGGGTVTAWIAQNRSEVERAVLLSPFFGIASIPHFVDTFLMNLLDRIPNIVFDNPLEPQRDWVYRGEATRGVAAFLMLGKAVFKQAESAEAAAGDIYFLTTAKDDTADNSYSAELAEIWAESGANVNQYEFEASMNIPHNSIDPATDAEIKRAVYQKILEWLGEE